MKRAEKDLSHRIEVMLTKASVDRRYRKRLLKERAEAAQRIGLKLSPAEQQILASVEAAQLEQMIDAATRPFCDMESFRGKNGSRMLSDLVASIPSDPDPNDFVCTGIQPDVPDLDETSHVSWEPVGSFGRDHTWLYRAIALLVLAGVAAAFYLWLA